MLTKTLSYEVKDVDPKGVVRFYASIFGNKDSDGDITEKGAFAKTIRENIKRIKHFKNHRIDQLIGVIQELKEDDTGLLVTSQLIVGTQQGRDTLEEYKAGGITEHSFGYDIIKSERNNETDTQILKELKLDEVSSLTGWGANELTRTVDIKNEKELFEYLDQLMNLSKGDFSDAYLEKLEKRIKQIHGYVESLMKPGTPPQPPTFEPVQYFRENCKLLTN